MLKLLDTCGWNSKKDLLLYQVMKEMCNISQGADDIAIYYTKMKGLWDELDEFDEIPLCSCTSAEKMHKREQNQELL